MKKLINDPRKVAAEALEGLALAYPQTVRLVPGAQAVVRKDAPIAGKVGVLSGGGSGHEPMFAGFVGPGMADGSVAGNIFASPPPQPIVAAAQAIHGGAGVLFLYGNYSGDVLNFDMAAEMLEDEGIHVSTVRITDDVASAPPERHEERAGIGTKPAVPPTVAHASFGWTASKSNGAPGPPNIRNPPSLANRHFQQSLLVAVSRS